MSGIHISSRIIFILAVVITILYDERYTQRSKQKCQALISIGSGAFFSSLTDPVGLSRTGMSSSV